MTYGAPNWRCEACETINSGAVAICDVCNRPRPVPVAEPVDAPRAAILRWLLIFSWLPLLAIALAVVWITQDDNSGFRKHLHGWLVVVDLVGAFVAWGLLAWGFSDRDARA